MARKTAKLGSLGADNSHTVSARIRETAKAHLSRKLKTWLMDTRILPAELARRADLPRDSISRYILKKSLPSEDSLKRLAKAMGVELDELMPNRAEVLVDPDNPTLEMIISQERPGKAFLRVDQLVNVETATKIINLLQTDNDPIDGKRSR